MTYAVLLIDEESSGGSVAGRVMDGFEGVELVWCRSYEEAFGKLFFGKWDLILINADQPTSDPLHIYHRVKNLSAETTPTLLYGDPQAGRDRMFNGLSRPQRLENILAEIKGKIATLQ